jgi:hypothetical protein
MSDLLKPQRRVMPPKPRGFYIMAPLNASFTHVDR